MTDWTLPKMPDVGGRPQDFYVVDARSGDSWNVATGHPTSWFEDTNDLTTATTLREIADQLDVVLSPREGLSTAEVVSGFNDVLAALRSDLLANAAEIDPT